jgi:transposase
MNAGSQPLPDDVAALRVMLLEARAERDAERAEKEQIVTERDQLAVQNDRLRHLLRQLQRMQFGRRSERLDPDQFNLALEDLEQAIAETEAEQEKTDPALKRARAEKRRTVRGSLPEHLPRVEVVIEPEGTACPCCGGAMQVIGEDRSQRLDRIPAQYQVVVTRRPKYACRQCQEGVVQAPAPARLIEGGLPTERLVAHVLVTKYADHAPLYRQCQIMARQGIAIDRSVLAFWVGYAAAEVKPLWRLMREELLRSTKLFADETTAPVLDPGRGRTKKGYFWALARDDRPWRGGAPPAVVYTYAPGRSGEVAAALLKGYAGVLQTDGYTVYSQLADPKRGGGSLRQAFCWAHWRRPCQITGANRHRGPGTDRRALPDRGRNPRHQRRGTSRRPAGTKQAARRGVKGLARENAGPSAPRIDPRPSHPLRPQPLGRVHLVPRRRPRRNRLQYRRAQHAPDCSHQKKCTLRRQRRGCRKLGSARLADRDLQVARRQSRGLLHRRPNQARQQLWKPITVLPAARVQLERGSRLGIGDSGCFR